MFIFLLTMWLWSLVICEDCSDVQPPNSTLTCQEIQEEGLCDALPGMFCKKSCKTCFAPLCDIISLGGLCSDAVTRGYCLQECNSNLCSELTEAQVLLSLKTSIQYPDQLSYWRGLDACDGWDGVICENGSVSELRLASAYFDLETKSWNESDPIVLDAATSIPVQFSCLQQLKGLYLYETGFRGNLPPQLSILRQLRGFNVAENNITGPLPLEFSVWTNIFVFDASGTYLDGPIPEQFSTWRLINIFSVSGNGYIPLQLSASVIQLVHTNKNQLTGSIPSQLSTWSKIQWFDANENQLTGSIPSQLSTWSGIQEFYTNENQLTGSIPSQLSTWSAISYFSACLQGNQTLCTPPLFNGFETRCPSC